jgi:malonyl-CoA decarboxylase
VPGFAGWLERERADESSSLLTTEDRAALAQLDEPGWNEDAAKREAVRAALIPVAATYMLKAKTSSGKPVDPVARFHLGNGARLERLNFLGDLSSRGMKQAHGLMVNYLYKLDDIETNHERFAAQGEVVAATSVRKLLRPDPAPQKPASNKAKASKADADVQAKAQAKVQD